MTDPVRVIGRKSVNHVIVYALSNGWEIATAPCSQYSPWRYRFSIWRPDRTSDNGGEWVGGAKTKCQALEIVQTMCPIAAIWHNCYDGGWGTLITPESYAHPAKMAYGLLSRILQHGIDKGYWTPGDLLGDPFGGIGTTGLVGAYMGLRVVSVELEPRFVQLSHENFYLHLDRWRAMGAPLPCYLQGDSRHFAEIVTGAAAVVTSPPYEGQVGHGGGREWKQPNSDRRDNSTEGIKDGYGSSPGQIGALPAGDLAAVVTSPPFGVDQPCASQTRAKKDYHAFTRGDGAKRDHQMGSEGNIAGLPPGNLAAVVTSPPYAESIQGDHSERETAQESRDARRTPGGSLGQSCRHGGYGADPGNIGNLKSGDLAAVVTSPPYISGGHHADQTGAWGGRLCDHEHRGLGSKESANYGQTPGQIGQLPPGELEGVVTSPPYANQEMDYGDRPNRAAKIADNPNFAGRTHWLNNDRRNTTYGSSPGQIGADAGESYWQAMAQVYAQCLQALRPGGVLAVVIKSYVKAGKIIPLPDQTWQLLLHLGFLPLERVRAMLVKENREPALWTHNIDHIGEDSMTDFDGREWSIVVRAEDGRIGVEATWPGPDKNHIVVGVYDPADTQIREYIITKKERKSFFRRLAEKKGSPAIDYEEVLFVQAQGCAGTAGGPPFGKDPQ